MSSDYRKRLGQSEGLQRIQKTSLNMSMSKDCKGQYNSYKTKLKFCLILSETMDFIYSNSIGQNLGAAIWLSSEKSRTDAADDLFIGSPVWKPRDSSLEATSTTLPRKAGHHASAALSASRKSLIETGTGLEIHNTTFGKQ
ncbi:unnamed protein product [Brassicogethes aeneus]|uniref:Uncharacterized protein n=1 Tax=Brassicogethes aeneus TaxID=1431903 RepID=A0A9P0B5C7_BRAAE|nr:unnamed protein product [Brassicogethes aeneus]